MSRNLDKTRALYRRAAETVPYGVNSHFRYWGPEDTMVMTRAEGPYMWDADGNRYIDYRLGFGPVILGHSYPAVVDRVTDAIRHGTVFAWMTPLEIEVAESLCRMTGSEMVRLSNTGTEATMHALRIARAYTGREQFIKFEGQYHGMHDYVLFSTASTPRGAVGCRRSPVPHCVSSGIPKAISQYVITLPFNDPEVLEAAVTAHWHNLAAILVEPVLGNTAGILPQAGWLETLRQLCDRYGVVLIFDEVKTGFRLAKGGAQELFGVRADLATYAKAMGNGFPISAIGGSRKIMSTLQPGGIAYGGTYVGNVAGVAAAAATLEILETEPVIETIHHRGTRLMNGLDEILSRAGIPHCMTGSPSMFSFALGTDVPPIDFRSYAETDEPLYHALVMALVERGAMPDADGREPWFLSYSHTNAVIDATLQMFEDAVLEMRR